MRSSADGAYISPLTPYYTPENDDEDNGVRNGEMDPITYVPESPTFLKANEPIPHSGFIGTSVTVTAEPQRREINVHAAVESFSFMLDHKRYVGQTDNKI